MIDVADLMRAADVWVEPSAEGGPGAVLEAMALEVPIVASDLVCTATPSPIVRRPSFPPDDPAAWPKPYRVLADRPGAAERARCA